MVNLLLLDPLLIVHCLQGVGSVNADYVINKIKGKSWLSDSNPLVFAVSLKEKVGMFMYSITLVFGIVVN